MDTNINLKDLIILFIFNTRIFFLEKITRVLQITNYNLCVFLCLEIRINRALFWSRNRGAGEIRSKGSDKKAVSGAAVNMTVISLTNWCIRTQICLPALAALSRRTFWMRWLVNTSNITLLSIKQFWVYK